MPRAEANGVELEYETFGDPSDAPLLLIAGLGAQMISWDEDFCDLLARSGFLVIRFDNRDSGLSTWMDQGISYSLDDMAADAAELLSALGSRAAHVVGASMGGFIAQLVALNHPERALTLTSIMSGPNGDDQIAPTKEGLAVLLASVPPSRQERIALGLWGKRRVLGPADPLDEPYERERVTRAIDRAYHPAGCARQLAAVIAGAEPLGAPALACHPDFGHSRRRRYPGAGRKRAPRRSGGTACAPTGDRRDGPSRGLRGAQARMDCKTAR
jgi:pimeloyl-ACP methyl ester carboxylesterase